MDNIQRIVTAAKPAGRTWPNLAEPAGSRAISSIAASLVFQQSTN